MGCQFGRWNFDGQPTPPPCLDRVRERMAPYGPEGAASHHADGVDLFCFRFATSEESRHSQPLKLESGEIAGGSGVACRVFG